MKDIDGVEHVIDVLKEHAGEIESHFENMNNEFLSLYNLPHDEIGRVLKCHLIIENFLNRFLEGFFNFENFNGLQLRFKQKIDMVPQQGISAAFVRPGIIQLNKVRNKFGHDLDVHIEPQNISAIYEVLQVARRGVAFPSPIAAIEAFTPIACAFLSLAPPNLQNIFLEAFRDITTHDPE